jgi:hypothetical protein
LLQTPAPICAATLGEAWCLVYVVVGFGLDGSAMVSDEGTATESSYLDRLARSERLGSWPLADLAAALGMLDTLARNHRQAAGEARVIDIRLQIYRQRLRRELVRRAAGQEEPPRVVAHALPERRQLDVSPLDVRC